MISLSIPASRFEGFLYVVTQLGMLEQAFQRSRVGALPVSYALKREGGNETQLTARTMEEFLDGAEGCLDEIEQILREFKEGIP
jgi:hypothetical protein